MISTGTGIAPFISFMQEYHFRQTTNLNINDLTLFFGSKNRDSDFIYEEEIYKRLQDKILKSLHLAFSRDQVKNY